ncbi:MAG: hypothetical protein GF353_15735 [Candidatus Lokiarchaeota archaeon]|nr:hypothetical protein [Candidatus Lokiarchaeota archaeon]
MDIILKNTKSRKRSRILCSIFSLRSMYLQIKTNKLTQINCLEIMKGLNYLKRSFSAYYDENKDHLPKVDSFNSREFGFIPWGMNIMKRHLSFIDVKSLSEYLVNKSPRHVYSSGSIYSHPDYQKMSIKEYQGCDFIVDIDVDHFFTSCKDDHDFWKCKQCDQSGSGFPPQKCPKCGSLKLNKLSWICENCLDVAKNEIRKLIYDFLIPDLGIKTESMKIAFSGHRGYHLKIIDEKIRTLSSAERRDLVDYFTGNNISFEILGLKKIGSKIYGLNKGNIGWSNKIMKWFEEFLQTSNNNQIEEFLLKAGLIQKSIQNFIKSKNYILSSLSGNSKNVWNVDYMGIKSWKYLLKSIVTEICVELDEPVSIDIHRLIRYPGSLHGQTGFKVQELPFEKFNEFRPLNELEKQYDPVVFESRNTIKIEITSERVPFTKLKDQKYGPYEQGEKVEVPNHVAIFLVAKGVAEII